MNDPRLDLENIRVCVILPICEFAAGGRTNSKSRLSSGGNSAASHNSLVNYDSNIESTCFSKPLISFTINSFERIHWIRRILVCSTLNRQEQVQELLQEYAATTNSGNESNKDRLKYICAQSISLTNGNSLINGNIYNNNNIHAYYHHHHNHAHHPENTFNRLLKFGLQSLRREEPYDIVIVHDVNLPYVEEPLIYDLTIEALKHGAASLCTSEVINNNFLFRFDQSNVENPENSPNFMKKGFLRSVSINSATISDFLNTSNYQIGFKPQSFQYSIFEAIFENCSNDELENDVDCVVLAKKYADITTKLIFDKNTVSNYSKRICCISHYLKENHKQALILSHKSNEDAQYLQSMLRANNWNTEICSSFDKDAYFKINELLSCRNVTDGIALIKMCESMDDLSEFNIEFTLEAATKIEDELVDEETDSQSTNMLDERRSPAQASIGSSSGGGGVSENKDTVSFRRRVHQILHHVLFVVKLDAVNSSGMLSPHDTVRCALRNNATVNSDIWSASEAMNPKAADLINYILSERNEFMKNQILEAF